MFPEAITFQFSKEERDCQILLPHQLACVRQTVNTLEFLWVKRSGSTAVVCVEGSNLGMLRRELLCGAATTIRAGACGPSWSRCVVTRIYHRLGWTEPTDRLALDPNPLSALYLQMETGMARDLWTYQSLDSFAIPRGPQEKLLFQFQGNHAYVMETAAGTFLARLAELKKANFTRAMVNRFSVFDQNPYPAFPRLSVTRYVFANIEYEAKNLAAKSEWEVIIDFRPRAPSGPSLELV